MEHLVELYKGKEPRVSTFDIFKGFGYAEHRTLKRLISNSMDGFLKYGAVFEALQSASNKRRGGQEKSFFLNEEQFMLLVVISKTTPESLELKMRIVDEFVRMRNALASIAANRNSLDWQEVRANGKQVYFQKTDVIKQFVEYATDQGSKNAAMYYANIAQMENKALFFFEQKYPNVREVLNIRQLTCVATADQVIEKALQDGMTMKLLYKDIYALAKERVIAFSNIIGKSLVIEFKEQHLITGK
jgi:phage regulator Rha-like protein